MSTDSTSPDENTQRPGWAGVAVILVAVVAAVVASVVMRGIAERNAKSKGLRSEGVDYFEEGREQRETMLTRLDRSQDVVLIGNSMLGSRIDRKLLREVASPVRADLLKEGNTFSLVWYLTMQEICATPEAKRPSVVVVFFRDRFLTWPGFRSNANGIAFAEGLADHTMTPDILMLVEGEGAAGGVVGRSLGYLSGPSDAAVDKVSDLALDVSRLKSGKEDRRESMNERFSLGNLRHDVPADVGEELLDDGEVTMNGYTTPALFGDAVDASFLPQIVQMANDSGVKLVCFRVQRRPDEIESSESLDQYMGDLKSWLEERGVVLVDENESRPFSLDDYADGDHISDESRPAYTRWFWETVGPLVEPRS